MFDNNFDEEKLRAEFLSVREHIEKKCFMGKVPNENEFFEIFTELVDSAKKGNIVSQDYVAYLYRRGFSSLIEKNHRTFMEWALLAVANGNKFSLERLKMFFLPAVEKIMSLENMAEIANVNEIYLENYEYVLGRLIAQAMVDKMQLNVEKMATALGGEKQAEEVIFVIHEFEKIRDDCIETVEKFLASTI